MRPTGRPHAASPLVLIALAVLGPMVATRLRRPADIGTTTDVFLALGILAFVLLTDTVRRRRDADAD